MVVDISKTHLHWRASNYKGKSYKSYSLARAVRQAGKNRKEIILPLGKLSEEEAEKWRKALKAAKGKAGVEVSLDQLVVRANYDHLDVAVALEIWRSWGLDDIFSRLGNHSVSLAAVAATLTINRCIDPTSKSGVCDWFHGTTLPFLFGFDLEQMNASRIFRELDAIEKLKTSLCDYLYKEHCKRDPEAMKSVFYDLSSTTFSGSRCLLMNWGHCKEGYKNHIVLALVVNQKGLPVYWAVLSGNTADVSTIEWLLASLNERFEKIAKPTLIFDRGMVSDDNLKMLENKQISYISAMDKNQLEGISGFDFVKLAAHDGIDAVISCLLDSAKFIKLNDSAYYREVPVKDNGRRYVLCFNPGLFADQRKVRQEAVKRFMLFLKNTNQELAEAQKSRAANPTLKKFQDALSKEHLQGCIALDLKKKKRRLETDKGTRIVNTFACSAIIDDTKLLEAGRLDGFWMLVTNQTDSTVVSAEQLIQPYRDKVVIEASFRDIKSFIEVAPVHVWTIDHVKAHYTLCVLAHLINRTLDLLLKECPGKSSQDVVSHIRLYRELSTCHLNHLESAGGEVNTLTMTRPTDIQKDLLARIGLTHILKEEFSTKFLCKTKN